ncbi:MAG: S8 family serine peptidase [Candidatus Krumholzibacteriaceae bacterium]|jgi:hypothetical protein
MSVGVAGRKTFAACVLAAVALAVARIAPCSAGPVGPVAREAQAAGVEKCSPRLRGLLASVRPSDTVAVWVFLADRGAPEKRGVSLCMSPRAAARRSLRGRPGADESDRPVYRAYVDSLRGRVARIRHASRFFNAVSVEADSRGIASLGACGYVKSIDLIASYGRPGLPLPGPRGGFSAAPPAPAARSAEYGLSFAQLNQLGLVSLLDRGYNGSGAAAGHAPLLIALLDTGFKLDHEALQDVHVEAQWDFVNGDSVVSNQPGDPPGQDEHGTTTLGIIAGRASGRFTGPAWGATYLLAKTEIIDQEIPIEEDHWVAGIEWADSAGADVVSSSLGYIQWYTQEQLDGKTALCTRAAGVAVSHGIVVVNSAGNQGAAGLVAPADGDSVLAIGAVDTTGAIAYFSSRGPTADGRIKPDFVARGIDAWSVSYTDPAGYAEYNGTSYAAPLVAGACAILLEMHPGWDPIDVRTALRATSSRSAFPGNVYGWGIPDAALASKYAGSFALPGAFPNPFASETKLQLSLRSPAPVTVRVYDSRGALVKTLVAGRPVQASLTLTWDGTNDRGERVASGVYFLRIDSATLKRSVKVVCIR